MISDRFADSTRAYQGAAGRLDPSFIRRLEQVAIGERRPDLTLMLDLSPEIGLHRATARRGAEAADRFEREGLPFHAALRGAFLDIARREHERCVVIDASGAEGDVATAIWRAVAARLGPYLLGPAR